MKERSRTTEEGEAPEAATTERPTVVSTRAPRTGIFRWSSHPASELPSGNAPPRQRSPEALSVLLRWTEDLDDERAVTLWSGLSAVEDPQAREAALLRWIDWAGVAIPLGVKLRDLVKAVGRLIGELGMLVADADRVLELDPLDLAPVTRALLGWMRAREAQPGVVLGAALSIVQASETLRESNPGGAAGANPVEVVARMRTPRTTRGFDPEALIDALSAEGVFYVPAYDRFYYQGMAHEAVARAVAPGNPFGATADPEAVRAHRRVAAEAWRRYLDGAAPEDPWRTRAEAHLRALGEARR